MFVLKAIDEQWKDKLKSYNFKPPISYDINYDEWYVDEDNEQALFYVGWVSECILRCDHGQSLWEFAFFVRDILIYVQLDFFQYPKPKDGSKWNEKNKLFYMNKPETGLDHEELENSIKKAIIAYLEAHRYI